MSTERVQNIGGLHIEKLSGDGCSMVVVTGKEFLNRTAIIIGESWGETAREISEVGLENLQDIYRDYTASYIGRNPIDGSSLEVSVAQRKNGQEVKFFRVPLTENGNRLDYDAREELSRQDITNLQRQIEHYQVDDWRDDTDATEKQMTLVEAFRIRDGQERLNFPATLQLIEGASGQTGLAARPAVLEAAPMTAAIAEYLFPHKNIETRWQKLEQRPDIALRYLDAPLAEMDEASRSAALTAAMEEACLGGRLVEEQVFASLAARLDPDLKLLTQIAQKAAAALPEAESKKLIKENEPALTAAFRAAHALLLTARHFREGNFLESRAGRALPAVDGEQTRLQVFDFLQRNTWLIDAATELTGTHKRMMVRERGFGLHFLVNSFEVEFKNLMETKRGGEK